MAGNATGAFPAWFTNLAAHATTREGDASGSHKRARCSGSSRSCGRVSRGSKRGCVAGSGSTVAVSARRRGALVGRNNRSRSLRDGERAGRGAGVVALEGNRVACRAHFDVVGVRHVVVSAGGQRHAVVRNGQRRFKRRTRVYVCPGTVMVTTPCDRFFGATFTATLVTTVL